MDVDYEWVRQQFTLGKVRVAPGEAVLTLLNAWEQCKLTDQHAEEALELFTKLARSQPMIEPTDEVWVDGQAGFIRTGDIVRVKIAAYTGPAGRMHNGRRCRVVATRSGDVIVNTIDDAGPEYKDVRHSPYALEKLVK